MKNVLELLEKQAEVHPEKIIFEDPERAYTYGAFVRQAKKIGTALSRLHVDGKPVALLMPRSVDCLCAMFGTVYAGGIYTVLDSEAPWERTGKILETLEPAAILAQDTLWQELQPQLGQTCCPEQHLSYEACQEIQPDEEALQAVRSDMTAEDPLYILFTSGSTGTPRGTVVTHRNVLDYIAWFTQAFTITQDTVFASQTPFYFSMSVSDVYATVASGGSLYVIPKSYFSFPIKLVEAMNEKKVNAIYWVPSAYAIIANLDLFQYVKPAFLKTALFAGEVMLTKYLNYWMRHLPQVSFANLFGPTETTDICTYFPVDRPFSDEESLPIGRHCDNTRVFLINGAGKRCRDGEEGELYVRGPFVAAGYYREPEKTKISFPQDPLETAYPRRVYRTGDICRYNDRGELMYLSRADFQIKHMGYRIEPGEIEACCVSRAGVDACACVYDETRDVLILVYQGRKKQEAVAEALHSALPAYMQPEVVLRMRQLPYNQNGKLDRKWLRANYKEIEKENK